MLCLESSGEVLFQPPFNSIHKLTRNNPRLTICATTRNCKILQNISIPGLNGVCITLVMIASLSTVSIQACSTLWAKTINSWFPSSLPRCSRPLVHAKILQTSINDTYDQEREGKRGCLRSNWICTGFPSFLMFTVMSSNSSMGGFCFNCFTIRSNQNGCHKS